jgi:hypothetical protein
MRNNIIYLWVFNGAVLIISVFIYLGILTDIKFLVDDPVNNYSNNSDICYMISSKLFFVVITLCFGNTFLAYFINREYRKLKNNS